MVEPTEGALRGAVFTAVILLLVSCHRTPNPATAQRPLEPSGLAKQPASTAPPRGASQPPGSPPGAPDSPVPGDIPDNQAFVNFGAPSGIFNIRIPEGWAQAVSGSVVTFADHYNSVQLEVLSNHPAVTSASIAAEVAALGAAHPDLVPGDVTTLSRSAGPVLRATYTAASPPDSVTGRVVRRDVERYDFWRDGTEVVVTLAAPVGSDNVDAWRTITDSFRWS